jgi:hypothetical protein
MDEQELNEHLLRLAEDKPAEEQADPDEGQAASSEEAAPIMGFMDMPATEPKDKLDVIDEKLDKIMRKLGIE